MAKRAAQHLMTVPFFVADDEEILYSDPMYQDEFLVSTRFLKASTISAFIDSVSNAWLSVESFTDSELFQIKSTAQSESENGDVASFINHLITNGIDSDLIKHKVFKLRYSDQSEGLLLCGCKRIPKFKEDTSKSFLIVSTSAAALSLQINLNFFLYSLGKTETFEENLSLLQSRQKREAEMSMSLLEQENNHLKKRLRSRSTLLSDSIQAFKEMTQLMSPVVVAMRKDDLVSGLVFEDLFGKYFDLLSSESELNKITAFKIDPDDQTVIDEKEEAKVVSFERSRLNALLNVNMFGCRLVVAMFVDRKNPDDVFHIAGKKMLQKKSLKASVFKSGVADV